MKNIVIYLILFSFYLFLPSCDDGCSDAAIDYGTPDFYEVNQKMFDMYKGKKILVLKNENDDTLNLNIKYSTTIKNDTVANTFKKGKLCTSEVYHIKIIQLDLVSKDNTYNFYGYVKSDFEYGHRVLNKKYDVLTAGWEKGTDIDTFNLDIEINDPYINKIPHKTVVIHGKNVVVIDKNRKTPEQAFIHEDKGIIAMTVPGKGTGLWVVDKIE
jgi:hypothetical protein